MAKRSRKPLLSPDGKKNLSIEETIRIYAGGEKFPKRKITEEQEKEWTAFLEEQRKKDMETQR